MKVSVHGIVSVIKNESVSESECAWDSECD